jgi:hypothetical protein
MPWPTPQDYNEAVQNPRGAFTDLDLRAGQPELTSLGLPRPISGNFACVYKIQAGGQRWAARCFISEVIDQQRRYEVISTYLAKVALPYTVQFTYLSAGIKVQGKPYPLLKMQWVQGESLTVFVGKNIGYPDTLLSLAKVWASMMADLKSANIAHGDLQHGNVVVVGDQLRLIDYDGMFVPGLEGKQSNECGHRNYQLPTRTGWDYGPYLDNFSAWVIYVSLVALAVHPELWSEHRGGDECLIFRKEDFLHPENSAILRDLNSSPNTQLRFLIELFTSLFSLSPQDVPSLDGNLTTITDIAPTRINPPRSGSNWWNDHIDNLPQREEQPIEVNRTETTESVVPDPSWIVDSLMDEKPVEPVAFQGQTKEIRVMILGSMALVILTRLLVEISASELFIISSCVFGLNLLFCFIRYKSDPSLADFEKFKKDSKGFVRQVREHQTLMDSISAEKLTLQEKLDVIQRGLEEQRNRLIANFQLEMNKAQAEINSQLQNVSQRRREAGTSETNKLNSFQGTLGNQILDFDRKINGLNQKEIDEKSRALNTLQEYHIQSFLRNHAVAGSWIPGIGAAYKSRLISNGFNTAADIDWRVRNVHGIGPTRQAALSQWRQGLEYQARQSAPILSAQDKLNIENKYRQERQTLQSDKQRLQTQFDSQVASVRQYFADVRLALNQEEQQLRANDAQKKSDIRQKQDKDIVMLDQKVVDARNQAAPAMKELSDKLRTAQKQVFALRWQSAKHEKEGRRFASLRFQNYLRSIIHS